jgi:hypothetical protein
MNSRNAAWRLFPFALPVVVCLLSAAMVVAELSRPVHGSGLVPSEQKARHFTNALPAQANPAAAAKAAEPVARSDEEKRKTRSAVLLLSILSAIALSGLLLIIAAVAVRGLKRKLSGPTQLGCEPQDMLPDIAARVDQEKLAAAGPPVDPDAASEETQFT